MGGSQEGGLQRLVRNHAAITVFPRGTARPHSDDVIARLPYVQDMGFDVLYLTPIHQSGGPIARAATTA